MGNTYIRFFEWYFLNFTHSGKAKGCSAGDRIKDLSILVQKILEKFGESEALVSKALPLLMQTVLNADSKIRHLVSSSMINFERAVSF